MDPKELVPKFIEHLKLPPEKAAKPFILGIIGNIGAGKTTVSRKLLPYLPGAVHVQANSARYLLKEAGMAWGDNVKQLVGEVVRKLVPDGYAVILDGATAEPGDRDRSAKAASELGVPLLFVRVRCETEVCLLRTQKKYDDPSWQSSFDDFRVGTTEKMVENVRERAKIHHALDSKDIAGLVTEVDANVAPADLDRQIPDIIARIKERIQ